MTDPATAAKFAHLAVLLLQSLGQQPAISAQTAAARPIQPPASITELGKIALDCHHRNGNFKSIQVLERPWSRGDNYAAVSSVLVQINWQERFGGPIRTRMGIVARDNQIRTIVQDTESPVPANRSCALNRWVKVPEDAPGDPLRAGSAATADLNAARAEITELIDAASAVAAGGKKTGDGNEAIRSDLIARLARSLRRAKAAITASASASRPTR
jgi:hypothetical protein